MSAEVETGAPEAPEAFSKAERAYFDSRGESAIPDAVPATTPAEPKEAPEPPKEEAAAPSEVSPKEDTAKEPDRDRKVDYGAFAEERNKRKDVEARLAKAEEMQIRMEERWKAMQERQVAPPQPPPRPPKAEEDIFGAVNHLQRTLENQGKQLEESRKREAAQASMNAILGAAGRAEADFRKTAPDYDQALNYLRQSRANELAMWGLDPQQVSD